MALTKGWQAMTAACMMHSCDLQNDSLFYFLPDDKPLPLDMPAALRLSRFEVQIDLPVIVVNSSNR